jgi:hypothetical protein
MGTLALPAPRIKGLRDKSGEKRVETYRPDQIRDAQCFVAILIFADRRVVPTSARKNAKHFKKMLSRSFARGSRTTTLLASYDCGDGIRQVLNRRLVGRKKTNQLAYMFLSVPCIYPSLEGGACLRTTGSKRCAAPSRGRNAAILSHNGLNRIMIGRALL